MNLSEWWWLLLTKQEQFYSLTGYWRISSSYQIDVRQIDINIDIEFCDLLGGMYDNI